MTTKGSPARKKPALEALQATIARLEGHKSHKRAVLPFGVKEIDARLPGGGLVLGALHEVAGGGTDALNATAAALFAAGIAGRTRGKVLWIVTRQDIFAPALDQAGLAARRVIHVEASSDNDALACFEEGLRHGGLGSVVAEVGRLTMTASRRLQIAAEGTGTIGLAVRRWRRQTEAADFGQPTASTTRWRVSVLPFASLPVPGVERPRWMLELLRARSGECADFEVEGCDANGRIESCGVALPAALADGTHQEEAGQRRA
ncbi:protein ImuA [Endobacter medicaginis]|uniref:Damage-inducible protein n=1 Tax=Endobacter medicaginis TaxID=1181271 RepID=A0A839UVC9_9PROT|nr:damage-inducible protein [Endobacter medicaginis]MBB3173746.1 protein ImuA [Endobacter medicaginis]MCX5474974.1 damage-inducible protein [Endobacter medicaginis]NVN28763.1 damage-inducible protein [Endobacter medicaginis]